MLSTLLFSVIACSLAPADPASPAGPSPAQAVRPPVQGQADLPPEPIQDLEAELHLQITAHCEHLASCACGGEAQSVEQCQSAASQTSLPAQVFACTSALPCPILCEIGPGGTASKGTTQCVIPYLQSQIPGGPSQGPALKDRTTTHLPLDDRAKAILEKGSSSQQ